MALFATLERDSPESDKLVTLAHLAADFKEKLRSDSNKKLIVLIYGYLTNYAASDTVKEEIERGLMNKSVGKMLDTLVQMGVPIDKLYLGEYVFSNSKGRKVDLFLEQQGEPHHVLPGNPKDANHRIPQVKTPKPVRDSELKINSGQELVVEVTGFKIESGKRVLIPELSTKKTTGISPVEISKGYGGELVLLRPKLEGILKKIGQDGIADKIEFAVKITGGAKLSKEFAHSVGIEIAAQIKAALNFNVTIPGTKRELPVELSYSYGAAYKDGSVDKKGEGMITITLFRFGSKGAL
jgi:hypothetical protein